MVLSLFAFLPATTGITSYMCNIFCPRNAMSFPEILNIVIYRNKYYCTTR